MKIIQLLARIEGSGVTRYVIELNKGLVKAGYDVDIIYVRANEKPKMSNFTQDVPNAVYYDYTDELVDKLNSADLVIVSSIMEKRANQECHDKWMDLVINKITTRKSIVVNDHNVLGFAAYYGPLLHNKNFWMAFDHIAIFNTGAKVWLKIVDLIGKDEAAKRFVRLYHPYELHDEMRNIWVKPEDKKRRVTYLGRHSMFKDPERLLRCRDSFYRDNWELEMRGIKRTIKVSTVPDLIYSFDENGNRVPSKACIIVNKNWKAENGIAIDDNMINTERKNGWCYVFDAYKREEGISAVAHSAFGADFFHLKAADCYGDNFEYTVLEMIEAGTIPMLDWNAGHAINVFDENFKRIESVYNAGVGVFLKKDTSNIDDCLKQMDELVSDSSKYEVMREKCWNYVKAVCDPVRIASKLVNDFMK